jgi:proline dehydrogenase
MLRDAVLALAAGDTVKNLVTGMPISSSIVRRFVAGESTDDVVATAAALADVGLHASIDFLGEDITDVAQAEKTRDAYLELLAALHRTRRGGHPLSATTEVSIKLSALGLGLGADGATLALDNARAIAGAATEAGTTVTVDAEDHTTTDATLGIIAALRADHPRTGAVVQAGLRRTEADCRTLAVAGSRVRLCKGAYREPAQVAFTSRGDIDRSYVRCMKILMAGEGFPMLATHDPRLIEIAAALAARYARAPGSFEYQMLHGVRPDEQKRLAARGETVRVYVPFGDQWYGYLMRRMAEKPANAAVFLRSLVTKK